MQPFVDVLPINAHDGALDNLIDELTDMIPIDKIYTETAFTYMWDSQVRSAYKYLKSKEFYDLVENLQSQDEYLQVSVKYLLVELKQLIAFAGFYLPNIAHHEQ